VKWGKKRGKKERKRKPDLSRAAFFSTVHATGGLIARERRSRMINIRCDYFPIPTHKKRKEKKKSFH
jgi:hypothetical protein